MTTDKSVRSANRLIESVAAQGVRYIFGIPGGKVDEVYDALADGGPELIVCRHEQNAVIALCGAVPLQDRLKRTHQSMNAAALLSAVTKYTAEVTDPGTVPEAVANAFRIATMQPRGAVALVLADDVMAAPTGARTIAAAPASPLGAAPASEIGKAASMIRSAARPVLLAGLRGADLGPLPGGARPAGGNRAAGRGDLPGGRGGLPRAGIPLRRPGRAVQEPARRHRRRERRRPGHDRLRPGGIRPPAVERRPRPDRDPHRQPARPARQPLPARPGTARRHRRHRHRAR